MTGIGKKNNKFSSYQNIEEWDYGAYTHSTIIHRRNFVDPNDSNIHTQNVENLWMRLKKKLRRLNGSSKNLIGSHICEFIWRNLEIDKKNILIIF